MPCNSIKKNIMFHVLCAELAVIDDPHLLLPTGGCRGVICKLFHSVLVYYLKYIHMEKRFLVHHLLIFRESYNIFAVSLRHSSRFGIYSLQSFNLYCLCVIFFLQYLVIFSKKSLFHKYFQVTGICFLALLLSNSLFLHLSLFFPTFYYLRFPMMFITQLLEFLGGFRQLLFSNTSISGYIFPFEYHFGSFAEAMLFNSMYIA